VLFEIATTPAYEFWLRYVDAWHCLPSRLSNRAQRTHQSLASQTLDEVYFADRVRKAA
jgi:hypothetical protein